MAILALEYNYKKSSNMIGQQQVSKSHRHLVNLRHFVPGGKFIRKQHDYIKQNKFTQNCEEYIQ